MRFSTILVYIALTIGLAIAGPTPDVKGPGVEAVEGAEPKFKDVPAPSGKGEEKVDAVVVGTAGKTVSKREDYNPLDERGYAVLVICPYKGCRGYCYGYNLSYYGFDYCYSTPFRYYSAYVSSYGGLGYGVYVAIRYNYYCYGMFHEKFHQHYLIQRSFGQGTLLSRVNQCYNISPYADTFFKKY